MNEVHKQARQVRDTSCQGQYLVNEIHKQVRLVRVTSCQGQFMGARGASLGE